MNDIIQRFIVLFIIILISLPITALIMLALRKTENNYNPHDFVFYDYNGSPLSNGCLVYPDHRFVSLDKEGECDPRLVSESSGLCVFDKRGNLIMEFGE